MDALVRLSDWYERQCVDEWYEDHGVQIDTLDNPGWSLFVDLESTNLVKRDFTKVSIERSEHNWVHAQRDEKSFKAAGGPGNLSEIILIFLEWAERDY